MRIIKMLLEAGAEVNVALKGRPVARYNGRTAPAVGRRGWPCGGREAAAGTRRGRPTRQRRPPPVGQPSKGRSVRAHGRRPAAPGQRRGRKRAGPKAKGATALQAACFKGDRKMIDLLLGQGAEVNAPGSTLRGGTALHAAAERNNVELVRKLPAAGADLTARQAGAGRLRCRAHSSWGIWKSSSSFQGGWCFWVGERRQHLVQLIASHHHLDALPGVALYQDTSARFFFPDRYGSSSWPEGHLCVLGWGCHSLLARPCSGRRETVRFPRVYTTEV